MPRSVRPIWLLTWVLIVGWPVVSAVWLTVSMESWTQAERMKGDTLAIPMFSIC